MDITINRLSEDEWEKYRDIRLEALKNEPIAFGSAYEEQKDYGEDIWKSRIRYALFALNSNKEPVGLIGIIFNTGLKTKHKVDIIQVYVKPDYRRKRIAKKLFEESLRIIEQKKEIVKINIAVNPMQEPAVKLYESLGFKKVGTLRKELLVKGTYYDEVLMEKFID